MGVKPLPIRYRDESESESEWRRERYLIDVCYVDEEEQEKREEMQTIKWDGMPGGRE